MPGTLNMWNNINSHVSLPVVDPNYADLIIGYAYSFTVANMTDNDIDSGVIELWNADADPDDYCKPGPFTPMEPVAGCAPIVSGIPEDGPVTITISPERPIPARSVCVFSAPCPKQFLQIRGNPAGTDVWVSISSLRRTDFSHLGPMGFIPQPLSIPFGGGYGADLTRQRSEQVQQQPPRPTSQPAPQPRPQRTRQPAE